MTKLRVRCSIGGQMGNNKQCHERSAWLITEVNSGSVRYSRVINIAPAAHVTEHRRTDLVKNQIIGKKKQPLPMRLHRVVILALLFLSLSAFSAAQKKEGMVGGWTPIKDLRDRHVAEIAEFAVTEYDKQSGSKLELVKVLKGETQVVAGTSYRLVLAAKDGSVTNNYEALVWEKPWLHFRNLTSFKPLLH